MFFILVDLLFFCSLFRLRLYCMGHLVFFLSIFIVFTIVRWSVIINVMHPTLFRWGRREAESWRKYSAICQYIRRRNVTDLILFWFFYHRLFPKIRSKFHTMSCTCKKKIIFPSSYVDVGVLRTGTDTFWFLENSKIACFFGNSL